MYRTGLHHTSTPRRVSAFPLYRFEIIWNPLAVLTRLWPLPESRRWRWATPAAPWPIRWWRRTSAAKPRLPRSPASCRWRCMSTDARSSPSW